MRNMGLLLIQMLLSMRSLRMDTVVQRIHTMSLVSSLLLLTFKHIELTKKNSGQSKSGVYLCKYPDVDLKFSESKKYPDNLTLKMIIFKVCFFFLSS